MKRIVTIALLLLPFAWVTSSGAASVLQKTARTDARDIVQVFLTFDTPPSHSYKLSGKRIDILLEKTIPADDLELFKTDDRVIRAVPSVHDDLTVLSLFFRYEPQKAKLSAASDGKLVLEVLLGNHYSRSYQNLSEQLKGITVVEEEKVDYSNPLRTSPYAYNWQSFIKFYEPPVSITVPLDFSLPPFPVIALIPPELEQNSAILPAEVLEGANQGQWNALVPRLAELLQNAQGESLQKRLALTSGELLLRSNNYEGAYKQLYLLNQRYPNDHVGILADYLLILLEARFRDPFLADYEFKEFEKRIAPSHPLAPYLLLSRAETALATRQYELARQLLNRNDTPFSPSLQKIRELRQGDYYNGTGQMVQAYVSYLLLRDNDLLKAHPYSLNGYCTTLYRQKKYDLAATCYRELAPQVSDSEPLGLIAFRTAMAEMHFKPANDVGASFARVEDAFPGSEAAARAAIKQTDLKYLKNPNWAKQAASRYGDIASSAVQRPAAAEAAFKEAILYSLVGDNGKSIELLLALLRDFQISEIRDSAQALLIDLLPSEIRRLIGDQRYLDALVLAKKNRDLFENNWLDLGLLAEIATAYRKVGIFAEAQRVYLYLLEVSSSEQREHYFLPLVQTVFDQGEYGQVEDFGSQYSFNYPEGKDNQAITILRLKALIATDQYDSAKALLPSPLPESREMQLLAATIHFHGEDYQATREILEGFVGQTIEMTEDIRFMLAESRFQLNDQPGAETLFLELVDHPTLGQQAMYRLAQIERGRGNEEKALKFFARIVEKDADNLWKKYAEKELEFARINQNLKKMIDG